MQPDEPQPQPTPDTPPAPSSSEPSLQDLMSGLNLTPGWVRGGGSPAPAYSDYPEERERGPRRDDRRGPPRGGGGGRDDRRGPPRGAGGPRPGGGRPGGFGGGMGGGGGGGQRRPGGDRRPGGGGGPRRFDDRGPRRDERPPRLPVEISFLPERLQLGAVVRQIHQSLRAYPLFQLARVFLSKPEYHVVKLEARAQALRFHVCTADQMLFLSEEGLKNHVLNKLVEKYFEPVDQQGEAPTGNFVCVGRCRMSGELLGPPNHHAFNEKLVELHRTRFAHLPLAEYRTRIDMVRDPAVIEQWKEASRTQRLFKPREGGEAAVPVKRAEAEARLLAEHWTELRSVTARAVIPAKAAVQATDPELAGALREAWTQENRNPFRMALALRPAFRRMRLHLFKANRGETFVTAVVPKALDPAHAIEPIQKILLQLAEHPGWQRPALLEALLPGQPADGPEAVAVLTHLHWLVEKGHVIEFFNGTLMVPTPAHVPEPAQKGEGAGDTLAGLVPDAVPEAPAAEAGPAVTPEASSATPPAPTDPPSPA